jgi:hypothetical protein
LPFIVLSLESIQAVIDTGEGKEENECEKNGQFCLDSPIGEIYN